MIFKRAKKSFVSVSLESDVEEGKIDKKAIDEEGKRYGGNAAREEREEPDKVAIFESVNTLSYINSIRNNFPLVFTVDSRPWNPITLRRIVYSQECPTLDSLCSPYYRFVEVTKK